MGLLQNKAHERFVQEYVANEMNGQSAYRRAYPHASKRSAISVHPHMLRHACGYNLAATGADTRAIQGFLGHRSIKSTERYTALSPDRFKGFAERLRGR